MKKRTNGVSGRRIALIVCSALALVALSVGVTIAYLSDNDTVNNTFTVGSVGITLNEGDVYEAGETDATDGNLGTHKDYGKTRVTKNTYKFIPGRTYDKDPTIHIDDDSEESYLRVKISVSNAAKMDALFKEKGITAENIGEYLDGFVMEKWTVSSNAVAGDTRTYVFDYKGTVDGTTEDIVIFKQIKIPGEWNNADMNAIGSMTMKITAEAIQASGFEGADDAWSAFDMQNGK